MRASRLLSILLLLETHGRMSAQALADRFEVSVRTIYRDIDELSAAGVPVYGDSGPGGGFRLMDGYRAGLTGMTADEAQTLLLAGFPQAIDVAGLAEKAAAARLKLQAATSPRATAGQVSDRIHLDPAPWYRNPSRPRHLDTVAAATIDARRLKIRYESWTRGVTRTVNPLGLVLKAGTWYLIASTREQPRTYRVSSIIDAIVIDEPAAMPDGFRLADYWARSCEAFERSLNRGTATIRVAPEGMRRLDTLGSAVEDAVRAAEPDAEGWRMADIPIESIENAAMSLLWLGPHFTVMAPPELRIRISELALDIANTHDETGDQARR